jgi:molybdopterin molybdotransferase
METKTLISFDKGLEIIKRFVVPMGTERMDLLHSLNRTLAEDVFSDISMPPFNKSAMDGYACRKSDVKNPLQVIEEIPAGSIPAQSIGENQCARIMTGAMVPEGADLVIMKEHIDEVGPNLVLCVRESVNTNICYTGEDIKKGDSVIRKGDVISPAHIAILASVGCVNPLVYNLPTVAIFSTGDELVEPGEIPGISKIRNSNSYQLMAQAQQMGITPEYLGIVPDNEVLLKELLKSALEKYDVILISGGVSVGDFDFVPKILKQLDVNIRVHGMEVKPGKHLLFGEKSGHFVFGMPGNPVSSFVQFEVLVKPFVSAMMGKTRDDTFLYLPLEVEYIRKKNDQLFLIPVTMTRQGTVIPVDYHGSAHIHAYTMAHGIMEIPQGILTINKGEIACVRPL